ncbi:deoxynucleotide monophosphate (dNMP) kinase [Salmon gill poxvirus]
MNLRDPEKLGLMRDMFSKIVEDKNHYKYVGFCGNTGSGKTTAIECLKDIFGETSIGEYNAETKLREGCKVIFGMTDAQVYDNSNDIIPRLNVSSNEILRWIESVSRSLVPDVFISDAIDKMQNGRHPINCLGDLKYPDEIRQFKQLKDSVVIKITRDTETSGYSSSEYDHLVQNNGSMTDLTRKILKIILKNCPEKNAILFFEN